MKKIATFLFFVFIGNARISANDNKDVFVTNTYANSFTRAYTLFPDVPKGMLEAISFSQTRFTHLTEQDEESCMESPRYYSVMGLIENGKDCFRNNIAYISDLTGYTIADIKTSPEKSIIAYAKAFSIVSQKYSSLITEKGLEGYKPVLVELSELPLGVEDDFSVNSYLYQIYWFLNQPEAQVIYSFPNYLVDLQALFGANYAVLSSSYVSINGESVEDEQGNKYVSANTASTLSADYAPALFQAASTCNYSTYRGAAISTVALHTVQGSYAGCISWFKKCAAKVAAHYVIRSSDGQVTQMVREKHAGRHIKVYNSSSIGIEHEGYISSASWYTNNMYNSSANLVRDICNSGYGISSLNCYFGDACTGSTPQCGKNMCTAIKGHQMFMGQTHTDPGIYWNWDKFYKLLNPSTPTSTITTASGTLFDSGGSTANYTNTERRLWLIAPTGSTSPLKIKIQSMALENNKDYLYVYNGTTVNSPLLARYTGTLSNVFLTASSGKVLVEFRSDCQTTGSGFVINYTNTEFSSIQEPLGDNVNNNKEFISVFPNPAKDLVTIAFGGNNLNDESLEDVSIMTINGSKLNLDYTSKENNSVSYKLTDTFLSSGIYTIQVKTNKQIYYRKLVIAK